MAPAGAGKSTLLEAICNQQTWAARAAMAADPDLRPVIAVTAPAPAVTNGTFAWHAFADRIADQLAPPRGLGRTVRAAIDDAARFCRQRGVRVILVEEARHLAMVSNKRHPDQGLSVLKEFSLATGVRFVLAGTYGLLDFREAGTEIDRRTKPVHLAPYDAQVPKEREAFEAVARRMLAAVGAEPSVVDGDLVGRLHERSRGTVGILRDWLVDAEYAMSRSARLDLAAAIADAQPDDVNVGAGRSEIADGRRRLGLGPEPELEVVASVAPAMRARTSAGQRLRPGELGPARRAIGEEVAYAR